MTNFQCINTYRYQNSLQNELLNFANGKILWKNVYEKGVTVELVLRLEMCLNEVSNGESVFISVFILRLFGFKSI